VCVDFLTDTYYFSIQLSRRVRRSIAYALVLCHAGMLVVSAAIFISGAAVYCYERSFGRIIGGGVSFLATVFLMLIGVALAALHSVGIKASVGYDV